MDHVYFVSGGSGFIGTWVVYEALKTGAKVKTSVRDVTNVKKTAHLTSLPGAKERLELVKLDLEKSTEEEFLAAVQGCTHVLHTASPFYLNAKTEEELIGPAVKGTMGVLRAAAKTPSVKSVVVTSSVASISGAAGLPDDHVYSDKDWNDPAIAGAYSKSKTLAEKAAWEFWNGLEGPKFTLCTINPSLVMGPCIGKELQTSSDIPRMLLKGLPLVPDVTIGVVDVRDVALAHIRAALSPETNGRRFILYNESVSMLRMAEIMTKEFPAYGISTRAAPYFIMWIASFFNSGAAAVLPSWGKKTLFDNQPSKDVLKISYHPVERSICDAGHSLIFHEFVTRKAGYTPPKPDWAPLTE
jgi:dihydroflavonol-4-reductase